MENGVSTEVKSFNLADIVEVGNFPTIKEGRYRDVLELDTEIIDVELCEEEKDIKNFLTISNSMQKKYGVKVEKESLIEAINNFVVKSFDKTMRVPAEFNKICKDLYIEETLVSTSQLPRTKMENIIRLSELLDMAIIEYKYLAKESERAADYYTRIAINKFKKVDEILKETNSNKKVYVLTPLSNLDLIGYIKDRESNIKYVPAALKQVQVILDLQKPFLRNLLQRISDLEVRVKNIEEEMTAIKNSIREMENRRIRLEDPMLFIADNKFEKESDVIIGPIWGPDMELTKISEKLNFKIKRDVRKKIEKIIEIYACY